MKVNPPQKPKAAFNDPKTSDCQIESWGEVFHCHRSTLSKSPFFRNAFKAPWTESTSRKVELCDFTADVVEAALRRLYGLSTNAPLGKDTATFFADVFALAEYLDIPALKNDMKRAFEAVLQDPTNGFQSAMESAQSVFENTPSEVRELRELSLACFDQQQGIDKILSQPQEAYALIERAPNLAAELLFRGVRFNMPSRTDRTPYYTHPRTADGRPRALSLQPGKQTSSAGNDLVPSGDCNYDHECHCGTCGTSFGVTNLPSALPPDAFGRIPPFSRGFQNPYAADHGLSGSTRSRRQPGKYLRPGARAFCPGCGTHTDLAFLEANYRNRYGGIATGTTPRRPGQTVQVDWGNLIG